MTATLPDLYAPIVDESGELEKIQPEQFEPMIGSIVVVVPKPKETTDGGLHIPEAARIPAVYGRVVAIPCDPECPVNVGDTVVFRFEAGMHLPFKGPDKKARQDLLLLQYEDGPGSEILGRVRKPEELA